MKQIIVRNVKRLEIEEFTFEKEDGENLVFMDFINDKGKEICEAIDAPGINTDEELIRFCTNWLNENSIEEEI